MNYIGDTEPSGGLVGEMEAAVGVMVAMNARDADWGDRPAGQTDWVGRGCDRRRRRRGDRGLIVTCRVEGSHAETITKTGQCS